MGVQWASMPPNATRGRATYGAGGLTIAASGHAPADSSPLTCLVGDRGYEAEVSIDLTGKVEAGLLLFYNYKALSAWASRLKAENLRIFRGIALGGSAASGAEPPLAGHQ
jgi:hypothetical protein